MKNTIIYFLCIIAVLSVTSCKKKVETCKLGKGYASDGNNTPNPTDFSYYSDGRLQKIVYPNHTKDTVSYTADSIIIQKIAGSGEVTSVFYGLLNSSGLVTAGTKSFLDGSGNVTSTETYALVYNGERRLLQKSVTDASGTTMLSINYDGGNSKTGTLFVAGAFDRSYKFYHSTVANKTGIDDMNETATPFFGKGSADLLDSTHIITVTDTIRIQYLHMLDKNDYVSKTIQTFLAHNVDTKYFTYQYFDCSE